MGTVKNPKLFNGRGIKSFLLRLFIHTAGDMSQPLHIITKVSH